MSADPAVQPKGSNALSLSQDDCKHLIKLGRDFLSDSASLDLEGFKAYKKNGVLTVDVRYKAMRARYCWEDMRSAWFECVFTENLTRGGTSGMDEFRYTVCKNGVAVKWSYPDIHLEGTWVDNQDAAVRFLQQVKRENPEDVVTLLISFKEPKR